MTLLLLHTCKHLQPDAFSSSSPRTRTCPRICLERRFESYLCNYNHALSTVDCSASIRERVRIHEFSFQPQHESGRG